MHKCVKLYMWNIHHFIAYIKGKFEPCPQMFINKYTVTHLGNIQNMIPTAGIFKII